MWMVEVKQNCSRLGNSAHTPPSPLVSILSLENFWSYNEIKKTCKLESFHLLKIKTVIFLLKWFSWEFLPENNTIQGERKRRHCVFKHSACSNLSPLRLFWKPQSRLFPIPPCKHTIYWSFIKYNLVFLLRSANLSQVANVLSLIFSLCNCYYLLFLFFCCFPGKPLSRS